MNPRHIMMITAVMLLMLFIGFTLYNDNIKKHREAAFWCGFRFGSGYISGAEESGTLYNESRMGNDTTIILGYHAGYFNKPFAPPPCMFGGRP